MDGTHGLGVTGQTICIFLHAGLVGSTGENVNVTSQVLLVVFPSLDVVSDTTSLSVLLIPDHLVTVMEDGHPQLHSNFRDSDHTVESSLLECSLASNEIISCFLEILDIVSGVETLESWQERQLE